MPTFDIDSYSDTAWIYNGSLTTGLLRGADNPNPNLFLTRYPVENIPLAVSVSPLSRPLSLLFSSVREFVAHAHGKVLWQVWFVTLDPLICFLSERFACMCSGKTEPVGVTSRPSTLLMNE
jgi:hypothetical protein